MVEHWLELEAMLKGKLQKIPQKAHQAFPNRLGSLVAGFEGPGREEDEDIGGRFDKGLESGEELETFHPNGLGFDREVDDQNEVKSHVKSDDADFLEIKAAHKHKKDLETVDVEEKRSDLDYEVRQRSDSTTLASFLMN